MKTASRCMKVLLVAAFAALPGLAHAQSWPAKTVRLVVPFPPGGGMDAHARMIAPKLSEALQQPVIIDNRPGAGGFVGTGFVAKAEPDGYTILVTSIGHSIAPALYRKLPFNPVADFVPVTQTVGTTLILVATPKAAAKSVQDMVAQAKAKPGVLNFGSSSIADPLHLTMELLKLSAGIDIVHVPYKGQAQVGTAILSGEVQFAVLSLATNLANIRAGTMQALAVTGAQRSPAAPEVPTVAESGFPGFEASSWLGLFAPAGTPREVVSRIQKETSNVLKVPEIRERMNALGQEVVGSTPEEFASRYKADVAKFTMIVKQAKIPFQD